MQQILLHQVGETEVQEHPTTFLLGGNPPGNPFAILRAVRTEVPMGGVVRLELRGDVGSIEVAHAVSIWRVCASRGIRFHVVVFSEIAYKSLSVLGLVRMLSVELCHQAKWNRPTCTFTPETPPHCPLGGSCLVES